MLTRFAIIISLSLVLLGMCGCGEVDVTQASQREYSFIEKENAVSISLLAAQLGLRVAENNSTHVTLKDSSNTVLIFTHTGGKFFVNGQSIGEVGEIARVGSDIYVPESLIVRIKSVLRNSSYTQWPKAPAELSGTVVIDAGHGGKDPGAISTLGFYEKTVNLAVARKVAYLLKGRGLKVIMTRDSDKFIELERRAEIANMYKADLFVSIHADSIHDPYIRGFTVYVANAASSQSIMTAKAIVHRMWNTNSNGHGIKRENFRVLVETNCPAVLVEIGYISNVNEASLIARDSFQNRIASAIAQGVCDVIGRL